MDYEAILFGSVTHRQHAKLMHKIDSRRYIRTTPVLALEAEAKSPTLFLRWSFLTSKFLLLNVTYKNEKLIDKLNTQYLEVCPNQTSRTILNVIPFEKSILKFPDNCFKTLPVATPFEKREVQKVPTQHRTFQDTIHETSGRSQQAYFRFNIKYGDGGGFWLRNIIRASDKVKFIKFSGFFLFFFFSFLWKLK